MRKKQNNHTTLILLLICLLGTQFLVASVAIFKDGVFDNNLSKKFFDFSENNSNFSEEKTDNENNEDDYEDIKIGNLQNSNNNFVKITIHKLIVFNEKIKKTFLNIPSSPPKIC